MAISRETLESLEFVECYELPIQSLMGSQNIKKLSMNNRRPLKSFEIEVIKSWNNIEKLLIFD